MSIFTGKRLTLEKVVVELEKDFSAHLSFVVISLSSQNFTRFGLLLIMHILIYIYKLILFCHLCNSYFLHENI